MHKKALWKKQNKKKADRCLEVDKRVQHPNACLAMVRFDSLTHLRRGSCQIKKKKI